MAQYEIILKNEKKKAYKSSLLVIIGLNLIAFLFFAYSTTEPGLRTTNLVASSLIAVSLLFEFIIKNKERVDFKGAAVILIIFFYFKMGYPIFAIGMILIYIFYLLSIRTLKVSISESIISYPSIPPKKISWDQLNNLLVKDGILTIDFKNNKLIQQTIAMAVPGLDEKEFNDFCREQLTR